VDSKREHLAVNEAQKLGIPVIGILDTNADPDELAYPIPGNDDAIRSVALLTRIIADAAAEGLIQRHQGSTESEAEPLAEWERELLQASENPEPVAVQIEQVDDRIENATITGEAEDRVQAVVQDAAEQAETAEQAESTDAEPAAADSSEAPAAEAPVEENDADAQADADLQAEAVDGLVPEHQPETQADVEAKEEAAATPAQKRPRKTSAASETE
jgi:small subunit ribosomal protein S2